MHNCKATREMISELLLTEANYAGDKSLLSDLENCDECRAEFDAVNHTLRITTRLIGSMVPPDGYWRAYHSSLKERLINSQAKRVEATQPLSITSLLAAFFKSSVRVPIPVAIGLLLSFVLSVLWVD